LEADWFGTLVPHMPWVVIVAFFAYLTTRSARDQTRIAWEAYRPHLRRKVYDIDAAGVSVDEGVSRAQYAWGAFVRFQETPNLLMLCPTDLTFEVIPKRSFASPAELDAARHLFATLIRDPSQPETGFPVVAPAAQAAQAAATSQPAPAPPAPAEAT
jgi:hypothetical protein